MVANSGRKKSNAKLLRQNDPPRSVNRASTTSDAADVIGQKARKQFFLIHIAQTPVGCGSFADLFLVSCLFGFCHYSRLRFSGDLGSRSIHDAVVYAPMGSTVQEIAIMMVAYSSAPTGIISFALILWGLRGLPPEPSR
jgi:hypothetical protein